MSGTSPITGYRALSQDEIDLMNEGKQLGILIEGYIAKVEATNGLTASIDMRWLSIGRTQLQQGLMALLRAIARPTTF